MLTIHQPNYWAYPGLIGKIMRSDKFLFLTKVQFDKSSWQNRNRIRIKEGWKYLTVPVENKGKEGQLISDVKISNVNNWRNQHLNAIKFAYQKAPYYEKYFPFIKDLYSEKWENLSDLDIYISLAEQYEASKPKVVTPPVTPAPVVPVNTPQAVDPDISAKREAASITTTTNNKAKPTYDPTKLSDEEFIFRKGDVK